MNVDLKRLSRDLNEALVTTRCSDCYHTRVHHWVDSVIVEDEGGNRRYCAVPGCECKGEPNANH